MTLTVIQLFSCVFLGVVRLMWTLHGEADDPADARPLFRADRPHQGTAGGGGDGSAPGGELPRRDDGDRVRELYQRRSHERCSCVAPSDLSNESPCVTPSAVLDLSRPWIFLISGLAMAAAGADGSPLCQVSSRPSSRSFSHSCIYSPHAEDTLARKNRRQEP